MRISFTLVFVILITKLSAAAFYGSDAHRLVPGAIKVITDERLKTIMYAEFGPDFKTALTHETFLAQHVLRGDPSLSFEKTSTYNDQIGWTHHRYRQLINNVPVEDGVYIVHSRNGRLISVNGEYYTGINTATSPVLTREQAFRKAIDYFPAKKYAWENDGHRPAESIDDSELRLLRLENGSYALCWRVDIFASEPAKRSYIYVDAITGEKRSERTRMYHIDVQGTAVTGYNGTVSLTIDSLSPTSFRLRNNARNTRTHDEFVLDITNTSNNWTSQVNLDQYETDIHWGIEKTHEFFQTRYGFLGIDGSGLQARGMAHAPVFLGTNAFWNGTYMGFGDGNTLLHYNPFTSSEIVGHEYAHGVTQYSAGLVYAGESGALNESFSDIVGNTVRFMYSPNYASWYIGDQIPVPNTSAQPFRNMANPNEFNCADCYGGLYFSTGDTVHYDSGIQNFWFYLLSQGGSGTNDLNNPYFVNAIGMNDAIDIAMRNLLVYLTPNSNFLAARTFSEIAAGDLFGNCSVQQFQTGNAWYAVGVGGPDTSLIIAQAEPSDLFSCTFPANIAFTNQSMNSTNFVWDFGDNTPTSTVASPTHTYTAPGTYTATLIAYGSTPCNSSDTVTHIITIYNIPGPVAASCTPNTSAYCCGYGITNVTFNTINWNSNNGVEGYADFTCTDSTLLVAGNPYAISIQTNATSSADEDVAVFMDYNNDGVFNNTNERVFSSATAVNGLHQGLINTSVTATLNTRLRMRVISDDDAYTITDGCYQPVKGQVEDYMIYFIANSLPPNVNFIANVTTVPVGLPVNFTDLTMNAPTQWNWTFTGAVPATSSIQSPQNIIYNIPGLYPVKLVATNSFGIDSLTQVQYINVISSVNMCTFSTFSFANGTIYDSGGPTSDYSNDENCTFLIDPCATNLTLSFSQFETENIYDFLFIYDGTSSAAPLVYSGTGTTLPPTLVSASGAFYLWFTSDEITPAPGFTASWTSTPITTPPVTAFSYLPAQPQQQTPVSFTDISTNAPTSWFWDFGDNTTSNLQNPTHVYQNTGTYTVTLIACNCFSCDTLSKVINVIISGLAEWNSADAYELYPNPFTGSFTLTLPDMASYSNVSIRLTDVAGRVLKQLQPAGKSTPVETNTLPSGMYFVEVYLDDVRMITLKAQAR